MERGSAHPKIRTLPGPSFRVSVPKYATKSLPSRKRGMQITGSSPATAAASRITTFTSATKPWARW